MVATAVTGDAVLAEPNEPALNPLAAPLAAASQYPCSADPARSVAARRWHELSPMTFPPSELSGKAAGEPV